MGEVVCLSSRKRKTSKLQVVCASIHSPSVRRNRASSVPPFHFWAKTTNFTSSCPVVCNEFIYPNLVHVARRCEEGISKAQDVFRVSKRVFAGPVVCTTSMYEFFRNLQSEARKVVSLFNGRDVLLSDSFDTKGSRMRCTRRKADSTIRSTYFSPRACVAPCGPAPISSDTSSIIF